MIFSRSVFCFKLINNSRITTTLYVRRHSSSFNRCHIGIGHNILTRWRVRKPCNLRHRPISTICHNCIYYICTSSHHCTRTSYPRIVPRIWRRRRCRGGVRRVWGWQPHIRIPQVGVAICGTETRVYRTH